MKPEVVLEKSQNHNPDLKTEIAALSGDMQDILANNIVKNYMIASITLGLVPVPLFDLSALTLTQVEMIHALGQHYGVQFGKHDSKPMVISMVAGSLPVVGVVGLSSFAKLIPGVGTLAGSATLSITAGAVSYALGKTFIMHFEAGGTLEDFDLRQSKEFFKLELEKGKQIARDVKSTLKGEGNKDSGTFEADEIIINSDKEDKAVD